MIRITLTVLCRAVVVLMGFDLCGGVTSSAHAQALYGGFMPGAESADSENSRAPFQFILKGVLNPPSPQATSLATLTLRVGDYHEIYRLEVQTVEAPNDPQMSTNQVLKSLNKYVVQLHVVGDKELLTKVGQSLPGTPITVTGLLIRKYRQLQIVSVDVFRPDAQVAHDQADQ
jgi:hypothetical protein